MTVRNKTSVLAVVFIAVLFFAGCEKKSEKPEEGLTPTDTSQVQQQDTVTQPVEDTPAVQIDLKGKWSGTYDQRSASLNITESTDSTFAGVISVAYRNQMTKNVAGKIDKEEMKFTMTDTQHSRYKGKYSGTISEEGKKIQGTFTDDLEGKNYSFTLTKK